MAALAALLAGATGCGSSRERGPADAGAGGHGGGAGQGGAGGQGAGDGGSGGGGKTDGGPRASCTGGGTVGFAPTEFRAPVVHCRWEKQQNVMSTPVVIDLDGDQKPEIVFPAFDGRIHAISGTDCSDVWAIDSGVALASDLAAGDLDGDGAPEIVAVLDKGLAVHDGRTGALRDVWLGGFNTWIAAAIANLDGVGVPEIVVDRAAFRFEDGKIVKLWGELNGDQAVSAVVDFDGDGRMEIVARNGVYDGLTGSKRLTLPLIGFAAVAEMFADSTGPEIVVVEQATGKVGVAAGPSASEPGAMLFGPFDQPGFGGGAPAVADFDGDGKPEFGVAGARSYVVYDPECDADPLPKACSARGLRWHRTTQDESSAMTTSTVFDFNCDGKVEVVYRDECWLRVYDGATGTVLFATAMTSNTAIEGAVVADTDGGGSAKIVVATNDIPMCPEVGTPDPDTGTPFGGLVSGLYVLRDPLDRWAPTRRVWNQNAYHIGNVDEAGNIPAIEPAPWTSHNTWRANEALTR